MSAFPRMRQLGFTLIELMIGVVVLAILLSIGLPNFQNWILNAQIRTAAESVRNGLQRARAEAVARNTNVEFALLGADDTCFDANTLISSTCTSWQVRLPASTVIDSRASSDGSVMVKRTTKSPTGAPATTTTFNNVGLLADNLDGSGRLVEIDLDSTKLAPKDSRELNVFISSPNGNVRMCDPGAPAQSLTGC